MYQPVCIVIMAHGHKELLLQLISQLQHRDVLLCIHIDKKSQTLYDELEQLKAGRLIKNRVNVRWAHISQLEAVFSSYKEITGAGFKFDHFVVISGQDYPLQPMDSLVRFFSAHKGKSFLGYTPISKQGWRIAMKRYRYFYYQRGEKWLRTIMRLTGIGRNFPLKMKPFGGSQWFNLSALHIEFIVAQFEKTPALQKFFKHTRFPEEMMVQSLLLNSAYSNDCINNDLRFIKWIKGKSNPEILTDEHIPEILENNDKFFARKFEATQSASLIAFLNKKLQ